MPPPAHYAIDTSSIFEWFVRRYPPLVFPALQARVEDLIATGRLRSPRAVLEEIKPGDDCHKWAKAQTDLFLDEDHQVQGIVKYLMATHHNLAKPHKGIGGADPFVIGLAKASGWCVISDEHPGSAESRKIPFVCKAESVPCMTFMELMVSEGWKF